MKAWKAILVCAAMLVARTARADASCSNEVTRSNIVACAVEASLSTRTERLGLDAVAGRRRVAGIVLPSNPALSVSGAYPITPGLTDRPGLFGATLSQDVEIGGQRRARLDVVSSEERAQRARLAVARRDAAADGLIAYFDVLAAAQHVAVANRLSAIGRALRTVARGRADAGVASDVEAQIAEAAATRFDQLQLVAQQREAIAMNGLTTLLGIDPATRMPRVDGELTPLPLIDSTPAQLVESAVGHRAEVTIATAEAEAQSRRAKLYERLRIPTPTISVFVKNDWIGENTVGIGIGLPIPLPGPLGRTYAGEIAEASALAQRADNEAERLRRSVRQEVLNALATLNSARKQRELYRSEQLQKTADTLRSIAEEIEAGHLGIRDALLSQQSLVDYLVAAVESKRTECTASVELARVAALDLSGGKP